MRGRPALRERPAGPGGGPGGTDPRRRPETGTAGDDRLYCAVCGHPVTRQRWRIAVNGAHEHVVFNPAGRLFRIGCFAAADGAAAVGAPTLAFTWFKGFAWRVATCAGCGGHLGWRYAGDGGGDFFGLILNALSETPKNSGGL